MRFALGRTEFRLHPLLPLALLLMNLTAPGCLTAFVCILLHEIGHMAAAHMLGAAVLGLEIMPLGGRVHIGGLYRLPAHRAMLITVAGPVVSLALMFASIMMPQIFSIRFFAVNTAIILFNLLPGMPMDGGRILALILQRKLGIRRSVRIAVRTGQGIGCVLLILTACIAASSGRIVIMPALLGVYITACAGRELQECEASPAEDIARLLSSARGMQPQPVYMLACSDQSAPETILKQLRADRCTMLVNDGAWESDLQWLRRQIQT